MFVKIVRHKGEDDAAQIEHTYECDHYETRFWRKDSSTGDRACLIIATKEGSRPMTSEIGEGDTAYFMNENGKTIDCIDWVDYRKSEASNP
jgi:hypothetical protein